MQIRQLSQVVEMLISRGECSKGMSKCKKSSVRAKSISNSSFLVS